MYDSDDDDDDDDECRCWWWWWWCCCSSVEVERSRRRVDERRERRCSQPTSTSSQHGRRPPPGRLHTHHHTALTERSQQVLATYRPAWRRRPRHGDLAVPSRRSSDLTVHTHTHTHTFNGPLSGTTRVSRYQKGKTNLDFTEARDSEWQWYQLDRMQVSLHQAPDR